MASFRLAHLFLTAALVLTACQTLGGSVHMVHKTGSTAEQRRNAIDACQVSALEKVPPSYKIRSFGGYYGGFGPGFCSGPGCYGYGGYAYPRQITSYDPNDALRAREFNRCLSRKGYTVIFRPVCTSEQDALAYKSTRRQAPSGQIACVSGEPRIESRWLRTR
ncbi:hypothetical protein [Roseibium aggregatum]|uniref:Uncharacterized protein n=1 Tax=Roseibium aggregatum TaxID=187304 RepID=A0A939EE44_9HYPH|nr:hypothetical protein [Roseibium aggregatum]MBN9669909.1 hypothetical protein [Roseibium aggregatum]